VVDGLASGTFHGDGLLIPQFDGADVAAATTNAWQPPVATTLPEAVAAYSGYARLALDLATKDPGKWTELSQAIPSLSWADRDEYIDFLEQTNPDEWTEQVRLDNSRALSEFVGARASDGFSAREEDSHLVAVGLQGCVESRRSVH